MTGIHEGMYTPEFAKALLQWRHEQNVPGSSFSGPDSVFNLLVKRGNTVSPWQNLMYRADAGDPTMGGQEAQARLGLPSLFKDPYNGRGGPGNQEGDQPGGLRGMLTGGGGRNISGGMQDFLNRGTGGLAGIDAAIRHGNMQSGFFFE